jgi:hypothetical protein
MWGSCPLLSETGGGGAVGHAVQTETLIIMYAAFIISNYTKLG